MIKKVLFCLCVLFFNWNASAQVSTADLFSVAANGLADPNCTDYCVIGVCISLICTPFGCEVETTAWIEHRAPDIVVSAHKSPGENSWDEASSLFGSFGLSTASSLVNFRGTGAQGGPNYVSRPDEKNKTKNNKQQTDSEVFSNLHFKEASAIGSPTNQLLDNTSGFCSSISQAFQPYFLSEADAFEWRYGIAEKFYPSSWVLGLREISQNFGTTWGGVHPRFGFIKSEHRARAAAVAAQRAADIITRNRQPHVYIPQSTTENQLKTLPVNKAPFPSNEDTDKWQMVYPEQDDICYSFGKFTDYTFFRNEEDEKFAFLYWQERNCCPYAEGVVVAQIPSTPICL